MDPAQRCQDLEVKIAGLRMKSNALGIESALEITALDNRPRKCSEGPQPLTLLIVPLMGMLW